VSDALREPLVLPVGVTLILEEGDSLRLFVLLAVLVGEEDREAELEREAAMLPPVVSDTDALALPDELPDPDAEYDMLAEAE
jgi:hypothetical protein